MTYDGNRTNSGSELSDRLRHKADKYRGMERRGYPRGRGVAALCDEAADEIENLWDEVAHLRTESMKRHPDYEDAVEWARGRRE